MDLCGPYGGEFHTSSWVVIKEAILVLGLCWESRSSVGTMRGGGFAPPLPSLGMPWVVFLYFRDTPLLCSSK